MTKLEEEIAHAMTDAQWGLAAPETVTMEIQAKAAAEVAKGYIERAIKDAITYGWASRGGGVEDRYRKKWMKENGITDPAYNIETTDPPY